MDVNHTALKRAEHTINKRTKKTKQSKQQAKKILDQCATYIIRKNAIWINKDGKPQVDQSKGTDYDPDTYSTDIVLWNPPLNWIRIEFEGTTKENENIIRKIESSCKALDVEYCITGHGGTSDYVNIVFKDIPINEDNIHAKHLFIDTILDKKNQKQLDPTNLGWTLSPVIGHSHWKPKYNGSIHRLIRGTPPLQQHNKFPAEIKKIIERSRKKFKKAYIKTKQSNAWVEDFLIDYCCNNKLPGGQRHQVIEKNLAALIIHHKNRDEIIQQYKENKKAPANLETWFRAILSGKYTEVSPGELIKYINDNNIPYVIPDEYIKDEKKGPEYTQDALDEGKKYFHGENTIEEIQKTLSKKLVGNEKQALLVFLAACSTQLPPKDRISIKIRGETSGGKTCIWENIYENIPYEWFTDLTRMTRAVLEDDINTPGIYGGELDKNDNKSLTESIKQYSEDGMKVWKKSKNQEGEWEPKEIIKDRGVVIYSTTTSGGDEEEDTRFISVSVESNPHIWGIVNHNTLKYAEDTAYLIKQLKRKKKGSWIQAGLSTLEKYDIISIPFSSSIKPNSISARTLRDLKRFLSYIKIIAWIHQKNRPKAEVDGYKILYAIPTDFYWASLLTIDAFRQTLTGIDERLQDVYNKVQEIIERGEVEYIEDAPSYDWVNRAKVQKELQIKKSDTVKDYSESLYKMGYLALHRGRGGSRVYLSTENILKKNDVNIHPLLKHDIFTQCQRLIAYLWEKMEKIGDNRLIEKFTPHLPTNPPTIDLPLGEKTPRWVNGGSMGGGLGGKLVGSSSSSNSSSSSVTNGTHHENKNMFIGVSKKQEEYIKKDTKKNKKKEPIHDFGDNGGWSNIDASKYKMTIKNAEDILGDERLPMFQLALRMNKTILGDQDILQNVLLKAIDDPDIDTTLGVTVDKDVHYFFNESDTS